MEGSGKCKPRSSATPNLGLLPLTAFAPKQKEAQSRQRSEVSIHTALMGPKRACGHRAGKKDLQNAVKTVLISHLRDMPWRRQGPRTREGELGKGVVLIPSFLTPGARAG